MYAHLQAILGDLVQNIPRHPDLRQIEALYCDLASEVAGALGLAAQYSHGCPHDLVASRPGDPYRRLRCMDPGSSWGRTKIRLWREKCGEVGPEDLCRNLAVQLVKATEDLNRRWQQAESGKVVNVQRRTRHPVAHRIGATRPLCFPSRPKNKAADLNPTADCANKSVPLAR